MNDTEAAAVIEQIKAAFFKWRSRLGLFTWRVTLAYDRGNVLEGHPNAAAYCEADYPYRHASIMFLLRDFKGDTAAEVEEKVLHELLHILVVEMQQYPTIEHVESVVSWLTSAFLWTQSAILEETAAGGAEQPAGEDYSHLYPGIAPLPV